jgi:hypothetical protein
MQYGLGALTTTQAPNALPDYTTHGSQRRALSPARDSRPKELRYGLKRSFYCLAATYPRRART